MKNKAFIDKKCEEMEKFRVMYQTLKEVTSKGMEKNICNNMMRMTNHGLKQIPAMKKRSG